MLFNLSLVRHLTDFDSILTGKLMMYRLYNWTVRWTEKLAELLGSDGCDRWHKVQLEANH